MNTNARFHHHYAPRAHRPAWLGGIAPRPGSPEWQTGGIEYVAELFDRLRAFQALSSAWQIFGGMPFGGTQLPAASSQDFRPVASTGHSVMYTRFDQDRPVYEDSFSVRI